MSAQNATTSTSLNQFSHIHPEDTQFMSGGLRDFFLYRDLGIAAGSQVIAQLVKADDCVHQRPGCSTKAQVNQ